MRGKRQSVLAALLLLSTAQCLADTAYVTDSVRVSIFANPALSGNPVEQLVSGSLVDVLQSQDNVAEIRSSSGNTGWLRTTFLTTNLPASIQLENANNEISNLNAQLKTANEKIATLEKTAKSANQDSGWMKAEMEKARIQAKTLENQLKSIKNESTAANQQTESLTRQLTTLETEKADLEQRLAAALMINSETNPADDANQDSTFPWQIVTILLGLALGFAGGYAWLDHRIRRRFGGIRVY